MTNFVILQPLIQHAAGHRIRSGQLKFRLTGALLRNSLHQLGCAIQGHCVGTANAP